MTRLEGVLPSCVYDMKKPLNDNVIIWIHASKFCHVVRKLGYVNSFCCHIRNFIVVLQYTHGVSQTILTMLYCVGAFANRRSCLAVNPDLSARGSISATVNFFVDTGFCRNRELCLYKTWIHGMICQREGLKWIWEACFWCWSQITMIDEMYRLDGDDLAGVRRCALSIDT